MGLNRELDGYLVVSIEQAVSAPYCGLLLADAGARVLKIEREEGDFARSYDRWADGDSTIFAWLNRGKESVCLDLNQDIDVELLHSMLQKADVFLHNLAPGALARRGFDGETLRQHNPALICCEINGYGNIGAAANKKAYDFLVQAESGLCSVTGTAEEETRVGISICDIATGLTAFSAILRALLQRARTGEGIDLSISMFDVLADWMNMPLLAHRYFGGAPKRLGLTHSLIAPYGAFSTGDGSQILIAIQNNREWRMFCEKVLGNPGLADDPRFKDNPDRVTHRDELHIEVNAVFSQKDRTELLDLLNNNSIACGQLSSVSDLSEHEFLRNFEAKFGDFQINMADLPVQIDGARPTIVPLLNQHGDSVRAEFINQEL
ncbi:MAG: itaconate CoA-transferase [Gammaproteobacteria bacterium]|jgi:itaconate CoA-transferase